MKHLVIFNYGTYVGIRSGLLVVVNKNKSPSEYIFPLNRLSTLSIAKRGVTFSSDLIESFTLRGIKLFFLDFRGVAHSGLVASHQHAVVAVRKVKSRLVMKEILLYHVKLFTGKYVINVQF